MRNIRYMLHDITPHNVDRTFAGLIAQSAAQLAEDGEDGQTGELATVGDGDADA